jgi:hypothetical protein
MPVADRKAGSSATFLVAGYDPESMRRMARSLGTLVKAEPSGLRIPIEDRGARLQDESPTSDFPACDSLVLIC